MKTASPPRPKFHRLAALFDHPRSAGETYGEHAMTAMRVGASLLLAGLACLVHAALPFLFERTGSRTITRLHEELAERARRRAATPGDAGPGA